MKAAARIAPSLRQALRPVPAARVAGPSRLAAVPMRFASSSVATDSPASEQAEQFVPPPNVMFEDVARARKRTEVAFEERAKPLHTVPADPNEPIMHPLSTLASDDPTGPMADGSAIPLPRDVFNRLIRKDILHRNVVWYLSLLRQGSQSTKSRSTVAYSGRKLQPQKGTGRARVGDASSGIRRGGAPIHALNPRDWAQDLPRKMRTLGLKTALSSKLASGALRIVESLNDAPWEGTNAAVRSLADRKQGETTQLRFGPMKDLNILFVYGANKLPEDVEAFHRKVRNIPGVEMLPSDEVEVYHMLKYRWLVLEEDAVDAFNASSENYDSPAALNADLDRAIRAELEMDGVGGINGAELEKMMEQVGVETVGVRA